MKFTVEFERIPAVGVLFGYDKSAGFIIMLPLFSLTIKRTKKKRQIQQIIDKF